MSTPSTYWDLVSKVVETVPEEGPLTRTEVDTWAWWFCRMVNFLEGMDWQYRGTSIKYQGWSTLMVVKTAHEGTPYVVFITERSTTACMQAFRRMLEEGRVEWRPDKFA